MPVVLSVILIVIAVIIVGPMLLIWALNTLVPTLAIAYTAWNWLAALVVMVLLGGRRSK